MTYGLQTDYKTWTTRPACTGFCEHGACTPFPSLEPGHPPLASHPPSNGVGGFILLLLTIQDPESSGPSDHHQVVLVTEPSLAPLGVQGRVPQGVVDYLMAHPVQGGALEDVVGSLEELPLSHPSLLLGGDGSGGSSAVALEPHGLGRHHKQRCRGGLPEGKNRPSFGVLPAISGGAEAELGLASELQEEEANELEEEEGDGGRIGGDLLPDATRSLASACGLQEIADKGGGLGLEEEVVILLHQVSPVRPVLGGAGELGEHLQGPGLAEGGGAAKADQDPPEDGCLFLLLSLEKLEGEAAGAGEHGGRGEGEGGDFQLLAFVLSLGGESEDFSSPLRGHAEGRKVASEEGSIYLGDVQGGLIARFLLGHHGLAQFGLGRAGDSRPRLGDPFEAATTTTITGSRRRLLNLGPLLGLPGQAALADV